MREIPVCLPSQNINIIVYVVTTAPSSFSPYILDFFSAVVVFDARRIIYPWVRMSKSACLSVVNCRRHHPQSWLQPSIHFFLFLSLSLTHTQTHTLTHSLNSILICCDRYNCGNASHALELLNNCNSEYERAWCTHTNGLHAYITINIVQIVVFGLVMSLCFNRYNCDERMQNIANCNLVGRVFVREWTMWQWSSRSM